jgi:SAM-dependent methyltransferase
MNMFLSEVEKYYSDRIKQHGITSKGVDWNTEESQNLRFDQLLKIVDSDQKEFSVLDYGCGYGALLSHINKIKLNLEIDFFGYDISNEMILKAKALFLKKSKATFQNNIPKKKQFDYVIASGVFNVKLNQDHLVWEQYVLQEITKLFIRLLHKKFIKESYTDS